MPRPEKVQAVADIKERIEDASAVFVTEFRGLTVKQLQKLRASLRDSGADYKVVKMTLARRATDELGIEGIDEHLVGPTGLTFANTDPVATAKALRDIGEGNDKLVIKAGSCPVRFSSPSRSRSSLRSNHAKCCWRRSPGPQGPHEGSPLYKGRMAMFAVVHRSQRRER
jgi:large subunit ribosomal protein L10